MKAAQLWIMTFKINFSIVLSLLKLDDFEASKICQLDRMFTAFVLATKTKQQRCENCIASGSEEQM